MATRLALAGTVLLGSLAAGALWRRAIVAASGKHSRELLGHRLPRGLVDGARYLVFTSRYCIACGELKEALRASGVRWREVAVESDPGLFQALGLAATPVLVELSESGTVMHYWGPEAADTAIALLRSRSCGPAS